MKTKPTPCPICGNDDPEVDYGLSDAPFPVPFVTCQTIHIKGDITSRCPMYADGIEAWNYICEQAAKRRPPYVAAPDEVISDLEFARRCDGVLAFAGHREDYQLRVKAAQMIARHLATRTATEDAEPKHLPEAADITGCSRVWFGVDDLGKPWWRLDVIMDGAETASYAIIPDRAALTPADAIAAREARDKQVRAEALREAMQIYRGCAGDESKAEAEIARLIEEGPEK